MRLCSSLCKPLVLSFLLLVTSFFAVSGCGTGQESDSLPPEYDPVRVLEPEAPGESVLDSGCLTLDVSRTGYGYIVAQAEEDDLKKSVQITGPGGVTYPYFIEPGETAVLSFTEGSGDYNVSIYQQIEGSSYAAVSSDTVKVKLKNEFYPWLYPNQYVSFSPDSEACRLAISLLPSDASDLEGLEAIYDYVISHISYDYEKADTVKAGYLPDIDETLRIGRGICFDYAALMTAMLRARDIPCRLVTGYAGPVKHAWIDVYIRSKGWMSRAISFEGDTWTRIDPTFLASGEDEGILEYVGNNSNYQEQYAH